MADGTVTEEIYFQSAVRYLNLADRKKGNSLYSPLITIHFIQKFGWN